MEPGWPTIFASTVGSMTIAETTLAGPSHPRNVLQTPKLFIAEYKRRTSLERKDKFAASDFATLSRRRGSAHWVAVGRTHRRHEPCRIDLAPAAAARHMIHRRDAIAIDGHVGAGRRGAGAVDHASAAQDQIIVCHCSLLVPAGAARSSAVMVQCALITFTQSQSAMPKRSPLVLLM